MPLPEVAYKPSRRIRNERDMRIVLEELSGFYEVNAPGLQTEEGEPIQGFTEFVKMIFEERPIALRGDLVIDGVTIAARDAKYDFSRVKARFDRWTAALVPDCENCRHVGVDYLDPDWTEQHCHAGYNNRTSAGTIGPRRCGAFTPRPAGVDCRPARPLQDLIAETAVQATVRRGG